MEPVEHERALSNLTAKELRTPLVLASRRSLRSQHGSLPPPPSVCAAGIALTLLLNVELLLRLFGLHGQLQLVEQIAVIAHRVVADLRFGQQWGSRDAGSEGDEQ